MFVEQEKTHLLVSQSNWIVCLWRWFPQFDFGLFNLSLELFDIRLPFFFVSSQGF